MHTLKVIKTDDSLALTLPAEAATELNVKEGDELLLTAAPGGFRVTPANPEIRAQLELGRKVMRENYDILRELAKR